MQRVGNPFVQFNDLRGALLDAGKIYIGEPNADPEVTPKTAYWDAALTIPALQPLRTRGGYIVNNGSPAVAYVGGDDYSMRVRDADGNLVSYAKTATDIVGASYQPLADALTELSGIDPSAIGLAILSAASAGDIKTLLGIGSYLALTGGTVSGNILRNGAGPHVYHNDASLTSGRIFITAAGATDPTSQPGDIWLKY
jgi:hypothetical protein